MSFILTFRLKCKKKRRPSGTKLANIFSLRFVLFVLPPSPRWIAKDSCDCFDNIFLSFVQHKKKRKLLPHNFKSNSISEIVSGEWFTIDSAMRLSVAFEIWYHSCYVCVVGSKWFVYSEMAMKTDSKKLIWKEVIREWRDGNTLLSLEHEQPRDFLSILFVLLNNLK